MQLYHILQTCLKLTIENTLGFCLCLHHIACLLQCSLMCRLLIEAVILFTYSSNLKLQS